MQGNGGTALLAVHRLVGGEHGDVGAASGVMAAAYTGRASGHPKPHHLRHGRHLDRCRPDRERRAVGLPASSSWNTPLPIHVPMVDVHHERRRRRLDRLGRCRGHAAGSAPRAPAPGRDRSATAAAAPSPPSPTPTLVLGPPQSRPPAGRRQSGDARSRARASLTKRSAGGWASTPRPQPPPSCASPPTAWPALSAWSSLSRGHDPRDFALFAFGGAGPLHATALARELSIPTVLVPARPGITNALGCVVADLRHDYVRTINKPLSAIDDATIARRLRRAGDRGSPDHRQGERAGGASCVACFPPTCSSQGQSHILSVAVENEAIGVDGLRQAFAAAYFRRFGIELPEIPAGAGQPAHGGDRRASGDLAGRAGRRRARADARGRQGRRTPACGSPTAGTRRRSTPARSCLAMRPSRGRRSLSSSTARSWLSRATRCARTSSAIC